MGTKTSSSSNFSLEKVGAGQRSSAAVLARAHAQL